MNSNCAAQVIAIYNGGPPGVIYELSATQRLIPMPSLANQPQNCCVCLLLAYCVVNCRAGLFNAIIQWRYVASMPTDCITLTKHFQFTIGHPLLLESMDVLAVTSPDGGISLPGSSEPPLSLPFWLIRRCLCTLSSTQSSLQSHGMSSSATSSAHGCAV